MLPTPEAGINTSTGPGDGGAVQGDHSHAQKTYSQRRLAKNTLRLPDLDHSKTSLLQSLGSVASKHTYAFAINDFIAWYCSEPRLAFGRTVVLRYRYELEARRHSLLGIDFVGFPGPRDRRRVALILGISRVAKCRALALNS